MTPSTSEFSGSKIRTRSTPESTGILPDCELQDQKSEVVLWWATQHSAVNEWWYCSKSQKWMLKERGVRVWTEFIWLRIQRSGRLLCIWSRTSGFNTRCKSSWLAVWLLVFQEGFRPMGLIFGRLEFLTRCCWWFHSSRSCCCNQRVVSDIMKDHTTSLNCLLEDEVMILQNAGHNAPTRTVSHSRSKESSS
jgi:hypothetical protein